jgi:hypothetical protein
MEFGDVKVRMALNCDKVGLVLGEKIQHFFHILKGLFIVGGILRKEGEVQQPLYHLDILHGHSTDRTWD